MKHTLLIAAVLLLPLCVRAEPVGHLDVGGCVAVATNAIAQQLSHLDRAHLRFDHATLRADVDGKTITVWFFLPVPDPEWEKKDLESGRLISVSMDLTGEYALARESKATTVLQKKPPKTPEHISEGCGRPSENAQR